jgi:hypothetical protein
MGATMTVEPATNPAGPAGKKKFPDWLFYVISVMLIGNLLYRLFVTANEYPPRSAQILGMVIDAAMIVALAGSGRTGNPLYWIAIIAGIGLFAIRLHGDASWWTGHWNYNIYAR